MLGSIQQHTNSSGSILTPFLFSVLQGVKPAERTGLRLEPEELKRWLDEGKPCIVLDTRNDYEVRSLAASGIYSMAMVGQAHPH